MHAWGMGMGDGDGDGDGTGSGNDSFVKKSYMREIAVSGRR